MISIVQVGVLPIMRGDPLAFFIGDDEERMVPIDDVISELGKEGPKAQLELVQEALANGATNLLIVKGW